MPKTLLVKGHTYKLKLSGYPPPLEVYVLETNLGNLSSETLVVSKENDYYGSRLRVYDKQVEKVIADVKVPSDMRKWPSQLACAFFKDEWAEIKREVDQLCSWFSGGKGEKLAKMFFPSLLEEWHSCEKYIKLYLKSPSPSRLSTALVNYRTLCETRALPHQRSLSRSVRRRLRQKEALRNLNNKFSKKQSRTRYSLGGRLVRDLEDLGVINRRSVPIRRAKFPKAPGITGAFLETETNEASMEESSPPKKAKTKKKIPF